MYDMVAANPNMLMQVMQTDARWKTVFGELTGIDLEAMAANRTAPADEADSAKTDMARKVKEAAQAEKLRKEKEAEMPSEERTKVENKYKAEQIKALGNELYKAKRLDEALEKYTEANELNPDETLIYGNIAAVLIEKKQYDDAIAKCDEGIDHAKAGSYDFAKLAKLMARKASALEKKCSYDEAIEMYR